MKTPSNIAEEIMEQIEEQALEQMKADMYGNSLNFHISHIMGALEDLANRREADRR